MLHVDHFYKEFSYLYTGLGEIENQGDQPKNFQSLLIPHFLFHPFIVMLVESLAPPKSISAFFTMGDSPSLVQDWGGSPWQPKIVS